MTYSLARSIKDLEHFLQDGNTERKIGYDTEATSLDTRRAGLVGFSVCMHEGEAMYVPLGHKLGNNLPWEPCFELLKQIEEDGYTFLMYNSKYDLNVTQRNVKWAPKRHRDVLELVYLQNPDRMQKGLKKVAAEELRMDMERFEDLFTPEEVRKKVFDISTKSPERCTSYASADADATFRLDGHFAHILTEQAFAVKIDTRKSVV